MNKKRAMLVRRPNSCIATAFRVNQFSPVSNLDLWAPPTFRNRTLRAKEYLVQGVNVKPIRSNHEHEIS